jgi:fumarylacetoacetate (FAA) hydrolase family protein
VQEGNTFLFPNASDDHLWMIISNPEKDSQKVVILRLLSFKDYYEQTFIAASGDHQFIKHASCIDYASAILVTDLELENLKADGRLKLKTDLSPMLLSKIREAVPRSRISLECEKALEDQGLLD